VVGKALILVPLPYMGLLVNKEHSALLNLIADVQRKMGRPLQKWKNMARILGTPPELEDDTSSVRRGSYILKCHLNTLPYRSKEGHYEARYHDQLVCQESITNNRSLLPYTLETRVPFNPFSSTEQIGVIPLLYWELNFI
jgi:hypothetical protein